MDAKVDATMGRYILFFKLKIYFTKLIRNSFCLLVSNKNLQRMHLFWRKDVIMKTDSVNVILFFFLQVTTKLHYKRKI